MGTPNYNFPEIDPAARFDGANDINNLANAIDSQMKQVEILGRDAQFELEPATSNKLGGVRIGANVNIAGDGTISTDADTYVLPPASNTTLGGVIVPADSGFRLEPDGTLSIDDASITLPVNSVGTAQIVDGAVTTAKIAAEAVTYEKLSASMKSTVDQANAYINGQASPVTLTDFTDPGTVANLTARRWGNVIFLDFAGFKFNADGSSSAIDICKAAASFSPKGEFSGMGTNPVQFNLNNVRAGTTYVIAEQNYEREITFRLLFNGAPTAGTYAISGTAALVWG
jgi:hypothetical protein|nr:MAG TPA: hypothetical protein [Bacteriophage sp.]